MRSPALSVGLTALVALAATGCITTNTVPLGGATYPPVAPETVQVFAAEADVPGDFERIAIIYAEGSSEWTNQSNMVEKMRREAAEVGGNGIVLGGFEEPSAGAQIAGAVFGVSPERRGQVLVIRYDPAAGRNAAAASQAAKKAEDAAEAAEAVP